MKHPLPVNMPMSKLTAPLLLAVLAFLSSCVEIRYLDLAQNDFNQGATLENQLKFNPQSEVLTSPSLYYISAYANVNHALQKEKNLEKDDLLPNAYSIKALCEWRLKKYDQAKSSADKALEEILQLEQKGIQLPRDKTLMEALPVLIQLEQAHQSLSNLQTRADTAFSKSNEHYLKEIFDADTLRKAKLEEALERLNKIRMKVSGTEDISLYLVQAQLAGLKTWSDALNFLRQSANADKSFSDQAKKDAREFCSKQREIYLTPKKEELLKELAKIRGDDDVLVIYWRRLI